LPGFAEYANGRDGARTFVIIDGGGAIINNQMTQAEQATLTGLMQVIQRTGEFVPLWYLTEAELTNLLGEDPHPYLPNGAGEPYAGADFGGQKAQGTTGV
jgi:hypothetical protein